MIRKQNAPKSQHERNQQGVILLRTAMVLSCWGYLGKDPSFQKGLWVQAKRSQRRVGNKLLTFTLLQLLYQLSSLGHYGLGWGGFFVCFVVGGVFSCISLIQNRPLRAAAVFIQAMRPDAWISTLSSRVYKNHWMRMGGTNQIIWAELEFILICYIPSPNWQRKNGRGSIGTRRCKWDGWIPLKQFLH